MSLRLKAAFEGDLEKFMKEESRKAAKAVTKGMRSVASGFKNEMRAQTLRGGLGQKMARSWRGDVYPRAQESIEAAAVVYTKAEKAMSAFEEGSTIRARSGGWLAVPTENAPKKGEGGKRISPQNFPEHRFGKLRFVKLKNGSAILVVDEAQPSYSRKTGEITGYRKASKRTLRTGHKRTTLVMFVLLPRVKMRKKIDFTQSLRRWESQVPLEILKNWRGQEPIQRRID